MGIFLSFRVAPRRISPAQWEDVYQEALQIVDHCDLMDRIFTERNGSQFVFARKTAERELWDRGLGILVCGTMASGCNMEYFDLFRNLEHNIRSEPEEDNGADILLDGLFTEWDSKDPDIPQPSGIYELWGNKTQGKPGHIPLLAIACLFADRFPEAVKVGGDVTAGQCRAAVRLANQCLTRPIQMPVTCRAEALARRLRAVGIPPIKQAETFFHLYLGTLTSEVGTILRGVFSPEVLYQYFRNELIQYKPEDRNFQTALRDYLMLGLEFSDLLNMLVNDPEGSCLSLERTLKEILSRRVHVPFSEKNCIDPMGELDIAVGGDSEAPHEIDALFGRLVFSMAAGRNQNLPAYVPLDAIREASRLLDPGADTLIDRLLAEQPTDERQEKVYGNGSGSLINMFSEKANELQAEHEQQRGYDVGDVEDLFCYHPGCTVYPPLMKELLACFRKVQGFDVEQDYQDFLALDRAGRETELIRCNRYILIHEGVWEHIFAHIMDDDYIRRYFFLFRVDCSRQNIYDLMEPLLSNPALIDELWEKTAADDDAFCSGG